MLHVGSSLISSGMQKVECAILPPGRSNEASHLKLHIHLLLIAANNVFHMRVLHVPP